MYLVMKVKYYRNTLLETIGEESGYFYTANEVFEVLNNDTDTDLSGFTVLSWLSGFPYITADDTPTWYGIFMSKSNRCTQRLPKVLWLCNEGWTSTLRLLETPLQWTSRGMPISAQSHFRVQTGYGECIQIVYWPITDGCHSSICGSDSEGTLWGPNSSTRQEPLLRLQCQIRRT